MCADFVSRGWNLERRPAAAATVVAMGHPLRELDPDSIYHVVSRGNNGGWIVRDAIDRGTFRLRLGHIARTHHWEVFAWCLMTNHVHVVLRAPEGKISVGMQELNGGHARCVNRRHGRTGHLFRNRFFSVEVATDAHLVCSIVYVNRNPLAAYLCETADEWRDSSYRATMGIEAAPDWLALDEILGVFGRRPASARATLADLVSSGRVPVSDTITRVQRFERAGLLPEPTLSRV